MTIYQQLKDLLQNGEGKVVSTSFVKAELKKRYNTNPNSLLLSDCCYNRYNKGTEFNKHLFTYINRILYEYFGENASYTGLIFHKPVKEKEEYLVGEWRDGKKFLYEAPISKKDADYISKEQIVQLFESYIEILRLELSVLKCKPTELRHLIGRIGEFYCAIQTNGKLTRKTNQHGFDVISNGRKISVKTTAQQSGFITINQNNFQHFDDLFVVQYLNDDFKVIFYGSKEDVSDISRTYESSYELDISKLLKKSLIKKSGV